MTSCAEHGMTDVIAEQPDSELSRSDWLTRLKGSRRKQLKKLYHELPVPTVAEFEGEFKGVLLDQGNAAATAVTRFFVNKEGVWLGKAFRPKNESMGEGYNLFRTRYGIKRCLRMQIRLRETNDGPQLTIEYHATNGGLIGRITDDLRRVTPGLFLGMGFVPLGGRFFPRLTSRVMFAMIGPVAELNAEALERDVLTENDSFPQAA